MTLHTRLPYFVFIALASLGVLVAACSSETNDTAPGPPVADPDETPGVDAPQLRPRANPSEYTGISVEQPISAEAFLDVASRLFGEEAARGRLLQGHELTPGLLLHSVADGQSADQVVLVVEMETSEGTEPPARTLAMVPASLQYGAVFVDAARAALALWQDNPATFGRQPFRLEHRTQSPLGGSLTLWIRSTEAGLRFGASVNTPRTSLLPARVNEPYFQGQPVESLYGLVYFQLTRDQFDFFSTRAYGITAGAAQNFKDFWLLPHNWLRLTVEPRLDESLVDVQFEVVTVDGRRVPLSRAPASLLAGEQFMQNVFRMVDNMLSAEQREPGSSADFAVPFYYDDPDGGGVVEVIAEGRSGVFQIAYAVETPVNTLRDTEFVAYQGAIEVPEDWDAVDPGCAAIGSVDAAQGYFTLIFDASRTVRNRSQVPLRGRVWGSVYRDRDVRITGPIDGAQAVASFFFEDVDIQDRDNLPRFRLDTQLPAGKYQILGFMDILGRADPSDADPSPGDPVFIPIGGYELRCAEQPVTVEFAIVLPEDR